MDFLATLLFSAATQGVSTNTEDEIVPQKQGWATKWRRHLDFTMNHACWCHNGHATHSQCEPGGIGDPRCFQNFTGIEAAKKFAEFMISMNVDSVQLESHPDAGWVTFYPTASGARPYPSLVTNKADWLGDTIKALRAIQTPNNKTLGVFLYMNVGSSNRFAGLYPQYSYSLYNKTPAFEGGATICQNAPGHLETLVNITREVVSRYQPDALRFDGLVDGLGHCYTEGDRAFYKELYNEDMPNPFRADQWRRQYDFYRATTSRTMRALRAAMTKIKPDIMTWANGYGPYRSIFTDGETLNDMDTCAETNDVAFSEFSSVFLWAIQQATTVPTKGTVNGCMLGCDASSMNSGDTQIEAAFEAVARGAIMYSYFEPPLMNIGTGYHNRGWTKENPAGARYNETLFRWFYGEQAKLDKYLDNATQVDLSVAIIFSEKTRLRYHNYFRQPYIQALESLYNMPLLARRGGSLTIQFINSLQLSGLSGPPHSFLKRFTVVVVFESSGFSAAQSAALVDFVSDGGNLVLSGDAMRFDEKGSFISSGAQSISSNVTGISFVPNGTECYNSASHAWQVHSQAGYNASGSLPALLPAAAACVNLVVPAKGTETFASLQVSNAPASKSKGLYPLITRKVYGKGAVYYQAIKWDNAVGSGSGKCGDGAANQSTPVAWSVIDEVLTRQNGYPYTVNVERSCHTANCTVCSACCKDWISSDTECNACVDAECVDSVGSQPLCSGGSIDTHKELQTQVVLTTQIPPQVAAQRWILWFLRKKKVSVTLHAAHINAASVVHAQPPEWKGYKTEKLSNGDLKITVTGGEEIPLRMLVLQSEAGDSLRSMYV